MGCGFGRMTGGLDELESMKTLCLAVSLVYVTQPIVADQQQACRIRPSSRRAPTTVV
jgi:hypothetical protein